MVVIHGLGSAATAFLPVLVRLRRHARRIVAFDVPGHGFSDPPRARLTPAVLDTALATAFESIVPERAILIGNSLGGALALSRAVSHPEKVEALVLLSPAGSPASDEEWERIRVLFRMETRKEARAFLERIYHRPPAFLTWLLSYEMPASVRRAAVRDLIETASNADCPTPEALAALPMPILFSWGRSERLFSDAQLAWFQANLPKHALIELPEGYGHCPHFDGPSKLADRILAFARAPR